MPNVKGHGLKIDIQEPEHYILGGGFIGTKEIEPSGDWEGFLPTSEIQNKNLVETMNCAVYATQNCIETLLNFHFREEHNYSERFNGILAETDPYSGNSPHVVAESIRKVGLIPDIDLAFDSSIDTVEKYYSPKPMLRKFALKGLEWLKTYEFKHEWVWKGNPPVSEKARLIGEALKRGPVGMSVYAWVPGEDGIYIKIGEDNHWVECYAVTDTAYKIFDTYDNTHKLYSREADVAMAKLYWVEKKAPVQDVWFVDIFKRLLDFISFNK